MLSWFDKMFGGLVFEAPGLKYLVQNQNYLRTSKVIWGKHDWNSASFGSFINFATMRISITVYKLFSNNFRSNKLWKNVIICVRFWSRWKDRKLQPAFLCVWQHPRNEVNRFFFVWHLKRSFLSNCFDASNAIRIGRSMVCFSLIENRIIAIIRIILT